MIMVAGETIPTRPDEISRSLPIPEYKIGWIIGKRGSYINQLAKKSGASISISDSSSKEYGTVWKYVQIRGSGRAVDRAKKLLHIRLERLEPRPVEEGEAPGHKVTNRFCGPWTLGTCPTMCVFRFRLFVAAHAYLFVPPALVV